SPRVLGRRVLPARRRDPAGAAPAAGVVATGGGRGGAGRDATRGGAARAARGDRPRGGFSFVADVASRALAGCDEYDQVVWTRGRRTAGAGPRGRSICARTARRSPAPSARGRRSSTSTRGRGRWCCAAATPTG